MSALYLSDALVKGTSQTSELRGGKYAARHQEGLEADGSPKYRYFKTAAEYQEYLAGKKKKSQKPGDKNKKRDKDKSGESRLSAKREAEQKESKRKQRALMSEGKKKKKEVETTKKSLRLYIEVEE